MLAVVVLAALGAASARGQSPAPTADPGRCLLSLLELNQLTGLEFVSMAAGPGNCFYDSDPTVDLYAIEFRIEGPDPTALEPMEDGLFLHRIDYPDGRDTSVGGYPAWESEQGLWVDVGDDVFVVQPILFFATDPPPARAFLIPVAELALPRVESSR
jgi:hypothetical protein